MPKEYKRKRLAEEWSLDIRPTKIKKQINSSERWRGKREIEKQLDDHVETIYDQWTIPVSVFPPSPCASCVMDYAMLDRFGRTIYRLGYVILTDYDRDPHFCIHTKSDTASES